MPRVHLYYKTRLYFIVTVTHGYESCRRCKYMCVCSMTRRGKNKVGGWSTPNQRPPALPSPGHRTCWRAG
eukprot:2819446-Pyramimonas_sp.AAC.1